MSQHTACSNLFGQEADLQSVNDFITRTVRYFMHRRGQKRDEAIEQTAIAFGITPRKVWQLYYREPCATFAGGLRVARDAYVRHLEQRERDFELAVEETRRERNQLELEI